MGKGDEQLNKIEETSTPLLPMPKCPRCSRPMTITFTCVVCDKPEPEAKGVEGKT